MWWGIWCFHLFHLIVFKWNKLIHDEHDLFISAEVQETEDSVQEIYSTRQHTQTANSKTNFPLWIEGCELVFAQISVPVMESRASYCDPHEAAHKIHDDVHKRLLVFRCTKTERDESYKGIYEIPNKNARSYNFSIRIFLFIKIPRATNSKKSSIVTHSVENQDDNIQDKLQHFYEYCTNRRKFHHCWSTEFFAKTVNSHTQQ